MSPLAKPTIWPIGGGKGGTGKSFFTGNIGILLAKQGFKTLLFDADLGTPNLHTIIGLSESAAGMADFISKNVESLQDTVLQMPIPNLSLVSGSKNKLDIANLSHGLKIRMFNAISHLDYDIILIDLGAGTSFNTIDFFTLSDAGILVSTTEPTSIENIYRLIRSIYIRKIRHLLKVERFKSLVEQVEAQNQDAVFHSPELFLDILKTIDLEASQMIESFLKTFRFKLVLNQVRKQDNPKLGGLICKVIEKHLGLKVQFLGNVSYDDRVHDAVCKKEPFIDKFPFSQTTLDLKEVIKGIIPGTIDEPAAAVS